MGGDSRSTYMRYVAVSARIGTGRQPAAASRRRICPGRRCVRLCVRARAEKKREGGGGEGPRKQRGDGEGRRARASGSGSRKEQEESSTYTARNGLPLRSIPPLIARPRLLLRSSIARGGRRRSGSAHPRGEADRFRPCRAPSAIRARHR